MKPALIISVLMAILVTGCASTQTADTSTPAADNESSKHTPYQGTIMAIDISANTVTVQTASGTMTMTINADTKFRGGSKTLSDYKVGDQVSGMFMEDDSGKMMAVSIRPYNSKG
jgi:outer membrane lipoprotein SlyB